MQEDEEIIDDVLDELVAEPEDAPKKKPGRPKKKVAVVPVEVHGIVAEPGNPDDILELVYCNPSMFGKLLRLYKQFEVSEVEMRFDANGVKMITKDHIGKSTIYATIDGRCMNLYYCKAPMRVCIKRNSLERVLGGLGKNHNKITIMFKEDYRSVMYIIIKDSEYDNDDQYEVDVSFKPEDIVDELHDDDTNHPIKFCVTSKHFKTRINQIKKLSETFTIQKSGQEPLQITFDRAREVNWVGVYGDSSKINLKSTIDPDEIFSVSVHIDYIKPFSNSNIGDQVYIAAHKHEKISFMTTLDKGDNGYACCVKIFTEIKEYRMPARVENVAQ